jgi:hypothetical protein
MKSTKRGKNILAIEVTHISARGFWLLIDDHEYFVDFDQNPWFRHATIAQMMAVDQPHKGHLFWKDLDVDLEIEALITPEKYPLVYK